MLLDGISNIIVKNYKNFNHVVMVTMLLGKNKKFGCFMLPRISGQRYV